MQSPFLQDSNCSMKQASHGLWGSAGLKMPCHACFFRWAILTCKAGQTDLDFGVPSEFISRSVHARLQVSVCSCHDLFHPGQHPDTHMETHRQHRDKLTWIARPAELTNKEFKLWLQLYTSSSTMAERLRKLGNSKGWATLRLNFILRGFVSHKSPLGCTPHINIAPRPQ